MLLLGAARDHVWPSADMVHQMESGPRAAGLKTLVFEGASHFISGTGEEPQRNNPVKNPEGNSPSPDDTALAEAAAWAATRAFLTC